MLFDDRLDTVLRNPASSEVTARAQFRQLLDLLGTLPSYARSERIDAAYLRLGELAAAIPAGERAAILQEPVLRLRSPRLVSQLALAEPSVAQAAVARADLDGEQWLDLIPALPVQARGVLRHRRGLPPQVEALLERLGIADRGLPPAPVAEAQSAGKADAPSSSHDAQQPIDEIGAIVRRIEAFRKSRQLAEAETADEDALLPLGGGASPREVTAFDFATDAEGRIVWAPPSVAPAAVGLRLASSDTDGPVQGASELSATFRHRQPIAGAAIRIDGAPAVAGEWWIDAAPRFDRPGGSFIGYLGRLRRPAPAAAAQTGGAADRMRQVLHELRTPVNAIQGFAEVIQQQLFGPTPHEYRALAATIASDSARMLAGFEELERLVKLDSGAMTLDQGECDLLPILTATIAQLSNFNAPRGSGIRLDCHQLALAVAMDRAEAERLVWRLLATLAGATAPREVLPLHADLDAGQVHLTLRLPACLAESDDDALFHAGAGSQTQTLAAGMFGAGFALRLAATEARAAGGALNRRDDKLCLSLPGKIAAKPVHVALA